MAQASGASEAQGAGESGLSRLIQMHVFNTAGDAAVAISLAGSLFFQVPSGEARDQVALFLGPHDAAVRDRGAADRAVPRPLRARPALGDRRDDGGPGVPLLGARLVGGQRVRRWCSPPRSACSSPPRRTASRGRPPYPASSPATSPWSRPTAGSRCPASSAPTISAPIAALASLAGLGLVAALRVRALRHRHHLRDPAARRRSTPARARASCPARAARRAPSRRGRTPHPHPRRRSRSRCAPTAGPWLLSGFLLMFVAFLLRDPDVRPDEPFSPELMIAIVIGAAGLGTRIGIAWPPRAERITPAVAVVLALLGGRRRRRCSPRCSTASGRWRCSGWSPGWRRRWPSSPSTRPSSATSRPRCRRARSAAATPRCQLAWVIGGFVGIAIPLDPPWLGLPVAFVALAAWTVYVLATRPRPGAAPRRTPRDETGYRA